MFSEFNNTDINIAKTNFKIDSHTGATKNILTQMVVDTLKDTTGLVNAKSDYFFDVPNKAITINSSTTDIISVTGTANINNTIGYQSGGATNSVAQKFKCVAGLAGATNIIVSLNSASTVGTAPAMKFDICIGYGTNTIATIIWVADIATTVPRQAWLTADKVLNTHTITYYISRNAGVNFTRITKDTLTDISSQPSGTSIFC